MILNVFSHAAQVTWPVNDEEMITVAQPGGAIAALKGFT